MMNYNYSPLYSPYAAHWFFAGALVPLILLAVVWTVVLKGFALWFSARGEQKWWFIAMLVLNTLGILEIVYLIWFRPKSSSHHHAAHHSSAA